MDKSPIKTYKKVDTFLSHSVQPFIGEPTRKELIGQFITSNNIHFVRVHSEVPEIDIPNYRFRISGEVQKPLELTVNDLKTRFPRVDVVATCVEAGLRKHDLVAFNPLPNEHPQLDQAAGTAVYSGVPLRDLLREAGARGTARHVISTGLDVLVRKRELINYENSIPIEKAQSPEVLVAYEMNGVPIDQIHGGPVRLVVPGYFGHRWVMWLKEIKLSPVPSQNYFHTDVYRFFPPTARAGREHWADPTHVNGPVEMAEYPVNCVILAPHGAKTNNLPANSPVVIRGYAIAGGGRPIVRIDISSNDGKSWQPAKIIPQPLVKEVEENPNNAGIGRLASKITPYPFAWVWWEATLTLPEGSHEVVARAYDSALNSQPHHVELVWNYRGYNNNAWTRVSLTTVKAPAPTAKL
eukprot:TRINITY_DN15125_c0_g1_i1.p1 TRINITY_DN15125_c0_g1~~TRINITY_DN15125_c0_g1_i1.p1  ORF type:complete len:409 (-),score=78.93 TRINITY_DN15125_c0_g1_i1:74-1300(-)